MASLQCWRKQKWEVPSSQKWKCFCKTLQTHMFWWLRPKNYNYGNNKFETSCIVLMGFIQHVLMSMLRTVCTFLNFFPSSFSFLLCPYSGSMNFEEAGSSILELLRGFNAQCKCKEVGHSSPHLSISICTFGHSPRNIFRVDLREQGTNMSNNPLPKGLASSSPGVPFQDWSDENS